MTICHVNTTFIHKASVTRRTFAVDRALADRGVPVTQVVGRDHQLPAAWDTTGIDIVTIPELVKYVSPFQDLAALVRLHRFFRQARPRVVHTHLAKAGIVGRLAARLAGVPVIVHTVHGPTFARGIHPLKRLVYRALERICGTFTDHFIFVGEELRQEYVRAGVCPPEKTRVIRSGRPQGDFRHVDAQAPAEREALRNALTDERGATLVGYVGRIVPSKNHDFAIRMQQRLRSRGCKAHLVIVGEGHLAEERAHEHRLRRLAAELGVGAFVHFVGFQSDVLRYTRAMDVLILPSRYEGLPNVAVEAGIAGRPMVACEVGGIREVLVDEVTGYVVAQGDLAAFTDRVAELAENPQRAAAMGAAARRRVEGMYDLDRMIAEKLAFYETLQGSARA